MTIKEFTKIKLLYTELRIEIRYVNYLSITSYIPFGFPIRSH